MRLKKLDLLIIKSYSAPLILTFFISLLTLMLQFLWKYIDDLVGKGLEWIVIAELLLYTVANLVMMALPLAILLASLMTFGNLGEHYELTAIKAAGISLRKVMKPLFVMNFLLGIGLFIYSNTVVPSIMLKSGALLFDVTHQRPELNIQAGVFSNDVEDFTIRVGRKNMKNNMMYDFMIYDHTLRIGCPNVTVADSGKMQITDDNRFMIITLYNGYKYEEMSETRTNKRVFPHQRTAFGKETLIFKLPETELNRSDEDLFKHNYQMLNMRQLSAVTDSFRKEHKERIQLYIRDLQSVYYFRNEIKPFSNDKVGQQLDSAKKSVAFQKLSVPKNLDSLFSTLPLKEKRGIYLTAVDYARDAQTSINNSLEDLESKARMIRKYDFAWHLKVTVALSCFIFFLIGASLGAIIRKGGLGTPVVIAVFLFIIYYILSLSGKKLTIEAGVPAYLGIWLSTYILFPLGIFLTYKATTDSRLLDADSYIKFLNFVKLLPQRVKWLRFMEKWF